MSKPDTTPYETAASGRRCAGYRRRILDISQQVSALHIGGAFSAIEIVDCIYHGLMRRRADGSSPDTFLMSKGHGCLAQYVVLEALGVLNREDVERKDYKTGLQEWMQARGRPTPRYRVISTAGPPHDPIFRVSLTAEDREIARGRGRTKKEAEQRAARMALRLLQRRPGN